MNEIVFVANVYSNSLMDGRSFLRKQFSYKRNWRAHNLPAINANSTFISFKMREGCNSNVHSQQAIRRLDYKGRVPASVFWYLSYLHPLRVAACSDSAILRVSRKLKLLRSRSRPRHALFLYSRLSPIDSRAGARQRRKTRRRNGIGAWGRSSPSKKVRCSCRTR